MTAFVAILALLLGACRTPQDTAPPPDTGPFDLDGDGHWAWEDCDDGDATVFPGAEEVCNEIDDDCDGDVDEGTTVSAWADADGDGWGDDDSEVQVCEASSDQVEGGGDCDDGDASINPDAVEVCDGVDNDCDGQVDEEVTTTWFQDADDDGWGDDDTTMQACEAESGWVAWGEDCDDTDPEAHPGAQEVCDGVDQDCDGDVDDGVLLEFWADWDGDGHGNPHYADQACEAEVGYVDPAKGADCDDTDPAVNPQAVEVCNDVDDDCDGDVDEDC